MVRNNEPPNGAFWAMFWFCMILATGLVGTICWAIVKVVSHFTG